MAGEVGSYWLTLKSDELRGAGQSNTIHLGFSSDADALLFADNLEFIFNADCTSVDKVVAADYATPYPAGTDNTFRLVMRGPSDETETEYLSDVEDATDDTTFGAAFLAGVNVGLYNPDTADVPTSRALIPYTSVTASHFPTSPFH